MKTLPLVSTLALSISAMSMANAAVVGESTNTSYVQIAVSDVNGGPHTAGLAGISIEATGLGTEVDFQGLTAYSPADIHGVNQLNYAYDSEEAPATHATLGVFDFAQVGSNDVWFGEWSKTGDATAASHTVYYSGSNADTSVPTSGTATYTVVGINDYDGTSASLLNGSLTANFGAATLSGSMTSANGLTVNLGTATIQSDASVTGNNAVALDSGSLVASSGDVSAQFYNGQADLAGLVDFAGTQYDTAFGGTQD